MSILGDAFRNYSSVIGEGNMPSENNTQQTFCDEVERSIANNSIDSVKEHLIQLFYPNSSNYSVAGNNNHGLSKNTIQKHIRIATVLNENFDALGKFAREVKKNKKEIYNLLEPVRGRN